MRDEQSEIDRLRRRAYGPAADIHDDPAALSRLIELEDLVRSQRAAQTTFATAPIAEVTTPVPETASAEVLERGNPVGPDAPPPRTAQWHTRLVAGTSAAAILLGAVAWTSGNGSSSTDDQLAEGVDSTAFEYDRRVDAYEASYNRYLDGLRDDVLTLPGAGDIAEHLVRTQLTPYGVLYGRTVGAGPTDDDRLCMIIADLPSASVTCIPVDDVDSTTYSNASRADPVSVSMASWYSDADSNLFTGLGELISFTLLPDGSVVAVPADSAPTPTTTPPPGWQ